MICIVGVILKASPCYMLAASKAPCVEEGRVQLGRGQL